MEDGRASAVLIGLCLAAFLAAVGASTFYGFSAHSQVTLINRSVETISGARLQQGDRETALGPIKPGQMRSANFIALGGSLTLTVTFDSGRTLSADDVGYIAPNTAVTVFFNVTDDKVTLQDVIKRNPKSQ